MEEGHSAITKGVKTVKFYGWKYKHYFIVVVTVIVTLILLKFYILAILAILPNNICMHDCVKVISNIIQE